MARMPCVQPRRKESPSRPSPQKKTAASMSGRLAPIIRVAAPSLVAHNYFQRKIETMAVSMEGVVADLLAKCYPEQR